MATYNIDRIQVIRTHSSRRDQSLLPRLRLLVEPIVFTTTITFGSHYMIKYFCWQEAEIRPEALARSRLWLWAGLVGANVFAHVLVTIGLDKEWRLIKHAERRYLISDLYGKARTLSMLGSIFHHNGLPHVLINMMLLSSVILTIPTHACTILQVYITGGVVSSLGTYIDSALRPELISKSCGSSGAIMAVLAYAVIKYPGFALSIPGLDRLISLRIPLMPVLCFLMFMDAIGLTCRWTASDHVAHIFGGLYGFLKGSSK